MLNEQGAKVPIKFFHGANVWITSDDVRNPSFNLFSSFLRFMIGNYEFYLLNVNVYVILRSFIKYTKEQVERSISEVIRCNSNICTRKNI